MLEQVSEVTGTGPVLRDNHDKAEKTDPEVVSSPSVLVKQHHQHKLTAVGEPWRGQLALAPVVLEEG